jgi:hypothetical protein
MKTFFVLLLCLFITACGSFPRDTSPAPFDNNFFTTEIEGCHGKNLGLAGCHYTLSEDLSTKFLKLNLFHKGEYEITSSQCSYQKVSAYAGAQILKISLKDLLANKPSDKLSCLFDVKIFVDGLDRGFRGMFIAVNQEDLNLASASIVYNSKLYEFHGMGFAQIRESSQFDGAINFKTESPGEIFWFGCELNGEKTFINNAQINFSEIFNQGYSKEKSCILEVGIVYEDSSKTPEIFTFNLSFFGKNLLQLSEPVISYKSKKTTVRVDSITAVIALDENYVFNKNQKSVFSFKTKKKTSCLRVITSNGRFNLYRIYEGKIIWKPLVIY